MTTEWSPSRLGNLTGKSIIVTGATNGVGLGTARVLARAGAHVILAVRNTDLGAQRAAEIGGSTSIAKLDLADLSSVRAFPDLLDEDVDILINNAGGLTQHRADTVDGFETTIGTNFLGPFAFGGDERSLNQSPASTARGQSEYQPPTTGSPLPRHRAGA